MNPLNSVKGAITTAFVLAVIVSIALTVWAGGDVGLHGAAAALLGRWLHILSGVMWIGLLWYFYFVQIPSMPKIPDEQKPAIGKVIAPTALFWFRWAALTTVVTGLLLAAMNEYITQALTFQPGVRWIGTGMWMALVMAFNVWFIIWPNQKKVLGIVTVDAPAKAAAAKMAGMASRINTMLSIPMLYCMAAQSHGGF